TPTPIPLPLLVPGLLAAILLRITITNPHVPAPPHQSSEAANLHKPSFRTVKILILLLAILFLARVGASVRAGQYQASDDFNYYLAAPLKTLQLHHYAADPFS